LFKDCRDPLKDFLITKTFSDMLYSDHYSSFVDLGQ
jgi:hypothetical protein